MNRQESLKLKKMINEMDSVNNTEEIRKVKHSLLIRDDIVRMERIKVSHSELRVKSPEQFFEMCQTQCSFLFNNYMDIFTKVFKDEINFEIMTQLLHVLKMIEDGKVDQHEGSFMVGKILKELYIDSALKHAEHLDQANSEKKEAVIEEPKPEAKSISWSEYKTRTKA